MRDKKQRQPNRNYGQNGAEMKAKANFLWAQVDIDGICCLHGRIPNRIASLQ